jgi:ATPase, P-type (transporting), HAD superfamily, subfamily IC
MSIFNKNVQEVLDEVSSNLNGLSNQESKKRLEKNGKNELESSKSDGLLTIFIKQFLDLLVIVLIFASVISALIGEAESAIVISIVIIINAILGTVQTLKAEKSLDSLKNLSTPYTRVIREGVTQEIKSDELVIGDIFLVEAGDVISADGRVIESFNLQVNEASLTGEVESIEKTDEVITDKNCVLGDQKNMVFSSGLVTYGRGKVVITSTGMQTEIGKIATLMNQTKEKKTPLQLQLDDFSKNLSFVIIIICAIVFGLNMLRGEKIMEAFMFAIALAVAAIPEALASIVTIILSLSTQKMVKENAIMKNINAIETLGCVSIICSDKTGTLTQNKMSVEQIYINKSLKYVNEIDINNEDYRFISKIAALCNDSTISNGQRIGDPTELAFIDFLHKFNKNETEMRNKHTRLQELPFDSVRKLMTTLHQYEGQNMMYIKGAPDELLRACNKIYLNGQESILTEELRTEILQQNEAFAELGQRVLAFAYKEFNKEILEIEDESNMIFVGLISLIDPPRVESKDAVDKCHIAGIKPIMITGDHKVTAKAIASRIGIYHEGDLCVEGRELEVMSEEELQEKLEYISVYARVAPEHKIRIVNAWQERGNNVAMTGDGVNDAPALKKANIGIAMGITGTEVSKDAASMILVDDNFSTIVKAVVTGRNVYANIKNSICYLLSGNLSGIISVIYCTLLSLPLPFFPVHLLFINLVTDSLPAIAIGMEKANDYLLYEKPRKHGSSILNGSVLKQIGFEGLLIAIATITAFYIGLGTSEILAVTYSFAVLCLSRLFHGFNCRSKEPLHKIGFTSNMFSIYAFLIGYILLHTILFVPALHSLFEISSAITIKDVLIINALAIIPSILVQITKTILHKK